MLVVSCHVDMVLRALIPPLQLKMGPVGKFGVSFRSCGMCEGFVLQEPSSNAWFKLWTARIMAQIRGKAAFPLLLEDVNYRIAIPEMVLTKYFSAVYRSPRKNQRASQSL